MRYDIYAATFESLDSNIHFLPADTGPWRNKTDSSEVETAKVSLKLECGVLQRFGWFCFFFFPNKNFLNLLHRTKKGLKTSKQESPFVPSHSALCWVSKRHPPRQLCFRPMCVLVAQSCPTLQPHGLQPTRHITFFLNSLSGVK